MFEKFNIVLRKMEYCDLEKLLDLKQESWFGTHRVSILNKTDQEKWFEKITQDLNSLILIASNDNPFGVFKILNIDWMNRNADVGWDIYKEHRGKGLGKPLVQAGVAFCFDILNLRRLNAEILENNVASQKCAESANFIKEGCKRQLVERCGIKIDSWIYGVLK